MTIPIIAKFRKAFVGTEGLMDATDVDNDSTGQTGIINGSTSTQVALNRIDGTGIGADIFRFTGSYAAQASNISEWFGGRQLTRLRCTSNGGLSPVVFTLPGISALNTAFDQLVTKGLPEVISFIIEYTGSNITFLRVVPRSGGPVITGTSAIIVNSGIAARVEITRNNSVLSEYVFESIGDIGGAAAGSAVGVLRLNNPADIVWDASTNGTLPTTGVVKGSAYKVVNAPADGSGRFDEVMETDDWVVWEGESFTSWSATPHQWFVLPAHEVRRISALENDFLTRVSITPESDRNTIIRGADYADSVAEIRLKIYSTPADYSAADLNTTGDIDAYTDLNNQTGRLAIRLPGNLSGLSTVLPTLYVFGESTGGDFTRYFNLADDFTHQGDFGGESDYLSNVDISYQANDTLRVYFGTVEDRYTNPDLDIFENNLSDSLQRAIGGTSGSANFDEQRLSTVESKVAALFPLTPDVTDLVAWADSFNPEQASSTVQITQGYSLLADYRGDSTRYESAGVTYDNTGTNVVTYTGLTPNVHRCFGMKVTAPANQTLLSIVDGSERIPLVDMTAAGNYRVNQYVPGVTQNQTVSGQITFSERSSGDAFLSSGGTTVSTFTVTAFPANATGTERSIDFELDIFLNGTDTLAGHFERLPIPAANTTQAASNSNIIYIPLGPLHGNRTVAIRYSYELRVSGSDQLIDFRLVSAPSDITVQIDNFSTIRTYTAPTTGARTDNWHILTDAFGNYVFTGENELLIAFHTHQGDSRLQVVPVAVDSTGSIDQLNDVFTPISDFSSMEIPDTIEFRTFLPDHTLIHNDLSHLLARRATQWVYGLAALIPVREFSVTSIIDFTQGIVLIGTVNSTRYLLTVDDTDVANPVLTFTEQ